MQPRHPLNRKRSHSVVEENDGEGSPSSSKRARQEQEYIALKQENNALKDEVVRLKDRIAHLNEFLDTKGLRRGKLATNPSNFYCSIQLAYKGASPRKDMVSRPNGAGLEALAKNILNKMERIYEEREDDICKFRQIGVTSDDFSRHVRPLLYEANMV